MNEGIQLTGRALSANNGEMVCRPRVPCSLGVKMGQLRGQDAISFTSYRRRVPRSDLSAGHTL